MNESKWIIGWTYRHIEHTHVTNDVRNMFSGAVQIMGKGRCHEIRIMAGRIVQPHPGELIMTGVGGMMTVWSAEFIEYGVTVGVSADVATSERITGRRRVMFGSTLVVHLESKLQHRSKVRIRSNMKIMTEEIEKIEVDLRRPN